MDEIINSVNNIKMRYIFPEECKSNALGLRIIKHLILEKRCKLVCSSVIHFGDVTT